MWLFSFGYCRSLVRIQLPRPKTPLDLHSCCGSDAMPARVSDLVPHALRDGLPLIDALRHRPARSASADRFSSRAIESAIGVTAYPNPGLCGRCVEAGSHALARGAAESGEGVGYAEDAVFDLCDRLDATCLGDWIRCSSRSPLRPAPACGRDWSRWPRSGAPAGPDRCRTASVRARQ